MSAEVRSSINMNVNSSGRQLLMCSCGSSGATVTMASAHSTPVVPSGLQLPFHLLVPPLLAESYTDFSTFQSYRDYTTLQHIAC